MGGDVSDKTLNHKKKFSVPSVKIQARKSIIMPLLYLILVNAILNLQALQ